MDDIMNIPESDGIPQGRYINLASIRNQLKAHPNYNVEDLFRLAMEQNWFISQVNYSEHEPIDYTLKQLTSMPFEQWAYLIEIENSNA